MKHIQFTKEQIVSILDQCKTQLKYEQELSDTLQKFASSHVILSFTEPTYEILKITLPKELLKEIEYYLFEKEATVIINDISYPIHTYNTTQFVDFLESMLEYKFDSFGPESTERYDQYNNLLFVGDIVLHENSNLYHLIERDSTGQYTVTNFIYGDEALVDLYGIKKVGSIYDKEWTEERIIKHNDLNMD